MCCARELAFFTTEKDRAWLTSQSEDRKELDKGETTDVIQELLSREDVRLLAGIPFLRTWGQYPGQQG